MRCGDLGVTGLRSVIVGLSALFSAALFLYSGNGLQGTLLAVRGNLEAFSLSTIGLLMSFYFIGFIAGSWYCPRLVSSVGHVRVFTALASVASATALAHAIVVEPWAWLTLRIITGFCFAGLAMVIESWINEKATNENRGQLLSVYRIVDMAGLTLGQLAITLAPAKGFELFALVSILVSLSLVPVALSNNANPAPVPRVKVDLRKLISTSPVAAIGVVLVGLANTCFWALGPIYVGRMGYGLDIMASFMSVAIVSAAIIQWPLGWVSDRVDRRYVIAGTAACVVGASALLWLVDGQSVWLLLCAAALFGASAIPVFGMLVAHANDLATPDEYVQLNGGLLMLYGLGAISGPLGAGAAMSVFGPSALFAFIGIFYGALFFFVAYRLTRRAQSTDVDKEKYIPLPHSSAAVFDLLPTATQSADPASDAKIG